MSHMLAIFDLEGVLVDGEFLPELAKLKGIEDRIWDITLKGIRGEINWEDGLRMRIEELKGASYSDCVNISNSLRLMPGAKEVCKALREMGFMLASVSGGFTLLAERVQKELGLDYFFANELVFVADKLNSVVIRVNSNKANSIQGLVRALKEPKEQIIAVVDGANDLTLFELAGLRVAFCAQPVVESNADVVIKNKDLRLILPHIRRYINNLENNGIIIKKYR
ncbi:MAG: phosphoserine phosphatase SerB [Nitrososphaerales archaeon]